MHPAIVSGIVTGYPLVNYWPIFFLFLVTVPEVFAQVNSAQFPPRFLIKRLTAISRNVEGRQKMMFTPCLSFFMTVTLDSL